MSSIVPTIAAPGELAHDVDIDGDLLTVTGDVSGDIFHDAPTFDRDPTASGGSISDPGLLVSIPLPAGVPLPRAGFGAFQ